MRISINLATRPFVELRPLFARLRLAMLVLLLVAVGCFFALRTLNAKAKIATAQMDALTAQTKKVQQERASNEARMQQPENRSVLDRAQFLNELFAKKSFSWTSVMMDLERVLPGGVQVTSIEPVISKEGDVSIRLRVTGDRDKAVQLVRNLETSRRFVAPKISSESGLTAEKAGQLGRAAPAARNVDMGNGVEFEINSDYNPVTESEVKKDADKAKPATVAPKPKQPVKAKPMLPPARPVPVAPKPAVPKPSPQMPASQKPGGAR